MKFIAPVKLRKNNQITLTKEVLEETDFKQGETLGWFKDPQYPGAIILGPIEIAPRSRKRSP